LRKECWVATGFTRWGAPVPQGSELNTESVKQAKMKPEFSEKQLIYYVARHTIETRRKSECHFGRTLLKPHQQLPLLK